MRHGLVLFFFVIEEAFARIRAALQRVINQCRGELLRRSGLAGMQALSGLENLVGGGEVFLQQFRAKIALRGKTGHRTIIRRTGGAAKH